MEAAWTSPEADEALERHAPAGRAGACALLYWVLW
jgi:hypothetical protein